MSKDSIRSAVHACFVATLPKRAELGNTEFRRTVMQYAMSTFSISLAASATHYNSALKKVKVEDPTSVEGLGRPEDKKGGRKSNAERERIKAEKAAKDAEAAAAASSAMNQMVVGATAEPVVETAIATVPEFIDMGGTIAPVAGEVVETAAETTADADASTDTVAETAAPVKAKARNKAKK